MAGQRKVRVLVVTADQPQAAELAQTLAQKGYQAQVTGKSATALAKIRNENPHIVFIDQTLPDRNGLDLLREIRKQDTDLCVIMLADQPTVEQAVASFKLGVFDYLKKPSNPADLLPVVEQAVAERGLVTDLAERVNLKIGERLRALRLKKDLTLQQVANRADVSVSLISQIERAQSSASLETLTKLASALGAKLESLFEGL